MESDVSILKKKLVSPEENGLFALIGQRDFLLKKRELMI